MIIYQETKRNCHTRIRKLHFSSPDLVFHKVDIICTSWVSLSCNDILWSSDRRRKHRANVEERKIRSRDWRDCHVAIVCSFLVSKIPRVWAFVVHFWKNPWGLEKLSIYKEIEKNPSLLLLIGIQKFLAAPLSRDPVFWMFVLGPEHLALVSRHGQFYQIQLWFQNIKNAEL